MSKVASMGGSTAPVPDMSERGEKPSLSLAPRVIGVMD